MSTEQLTNMLVAGGVVGVFLDPFITFIKTRFDLEHHRRIKSAISIITSLLGGVIVVVIAGLPVENLSNILVAGGTVFASATITYNLYWKDVEKKLDVK